MRVSRSAALHKNAGIAGLGCGLLALSGCDPGYGIMRGLTYDHAVDVTCIESALSSAAGVSNVQHEVEEIHSFAIMPTFGPGIRTNHNFSYDADGLVIGLLVVDDAPYRETRFVQFRVQIGERVPRPEIEAARTIMLRVEQNISRECRLSFERVEESVS